MIQSSWPPKAAIDFFNRVQLSEYAQEEVERTATDFLILGVRSYLEPALLNIAIGHFIESYQGEFVDTVISALDAYDTMPDDSYSFSRDSLTQIQTKAESIDWAKSDQLIELCDQCREIPGIN